ncbi:solute carrier family 22 member 18 isoform X2 [Erinaceus europaeus]|uniref:Solute carrier family 22 member 18 isoform X2 n=1 Tax=Erinaceus europaeus TaxID=9365 RepID=A0ABM3W9L5_ERIEU|nr:solute carrier family 22 member 18 isoform X2 [Erinaceus europaeus]
MQAGPTQAGPTQAGPTQAGPTQAPGRLSPAARARVLLLTYALAAVELTCLFMQFSTVPAVSPWPGPGDAPAPVFQYLSRSLGLDSVGFGYLQTTFGVLQLLGGPMFGRFADQRGARAAFTLSFLAASTLYLLLAAACSPALPGLALLFLSRLPGGLMHTLPAAQMVITDLTAAEQRQAALGRLGLCFGVGMILGSLLGGTLSSSCGLHCPALVALVASLVGILLSVTGIPASTKAAGGCTQAAPPGGPKAGVFDLKAIVRLFLLPGVLSIFLVKVVSGFPSGLFMVMFPIISMDFFQLEAAQAGYLMSFFGVLQMLIQGLVLGRLSRHFSEGTLLRASVLVFCGVGLGMALMANTLHLCLLAPGLVFGLCVLNVVTDSMLTKAVAATDTGTMLGLCASVQPLTRTLGPALGGLLYRNLGVAVFGHVQLAVNFLVLLFLRRLPGPQEGIKVQ